jgi:hypothetical protein
MDVAPMTPGPAAHPAGEAKASHGKASRADEPAPKHSGRPPEPDSPPKAKGPLPRPLPHSIWEPIPGEPPQVGDLRSPGAV